MSLAILTMMVIWGSGKLTKALPALLVGIVLTTIVVLGFGLDLRNVGSMASIAGGPPTFGIPDVPRFDVQLRESTRWLRQRSGRHRTLLAWRCIVRSPFLLIVCLGCLFPGSCGKESGVPTSSQAADPAPVAESPVGQHYEGTGFLPLRGPSIHMDGSHKLAEGGRTLCLCVSTTIDLRTYEGQKVKLSGPSLRTVEGNQSIVDVKTIEVVR